MDKLNLKFVLIFVKDYKIYNNKVLEDLKHTLKKLIL